MRSRSVLYGSVAFALSCAAFGASPGAPAPAPGEGINNTDADLFEFEGRTSIYYATGDQATWGTIRVALYEGPMREMLERHFPAGWPTATFDARERRYVYPWPDARPSQPGPPEPLACPMSSSTTDWKRVTT